MMDSAVHKWSFNRVPSSWRNAAAPTLQKTTIFRTSLQIVKPYLVLR